LRVAPNPPRRIMGTLSLRPLRAESKAHRLPTSQAEPDDLHIRCLYEVLNQGTGTYRLGHTFAGSSNIIQASRSSSETTVCDLQESATRMDHCVFDV
jgi:hypothetical protein